MNVDEEQQAKDELRTALAKVLGPKLPGVTGVGVGLDRRTKEVGLTVMVDRTLGERLRSALPRVIRGLPIHISPVGIARLD